MTGKAQQDDEGNALTPKAIATIIEIEEAEKLSAEALSIRAAGGFKKWTAMHRPDFLAFKAEMQGRSAVQVQWESIAHSLAHMACEERLARTPAGWAWAFSEELRLNNRGMDKATQGAAEAQIMSTFEAQADTLPLRQMPSGLQWPKGQPLPQKWCEASYLTKAELRTWAKEHAPELLGSTLLAEAAPASPAEQWSGASAARKRELATEAVKLRGTQEKAAASFGITRQRLAAVLRNSDATVASAFPESAWKPHKT